MSLSSVDRIEDLINPSDVVFWYSADDINLSIGSDITTNINSRFVTNVGVKQNKAGRAKLIVDDKGFKCIETRAIPSFTDYFITTNLFTPTNNETFIVVAAMETSSTNYVGIIGDIVGPTYSSQFNFQSYNSYSFNYSNHVVGSGRVTFYKADMVFSSYMKQILVGVMQPNKLRLIVKNPTGSYDVNIADPTNLVSPTGVKNTIFLSGLTNPLGQKARHYCAIRIANTYSEDTLKKIIRRVAFEHGVRL